MSGRKPRKNARMEEEDGSSGSEFDSDAMEEEEASNKNEVKFLTKRLKCLLTLISCIRKYKWTLKVAILQAVTSMAFGNCCSSCS